MIAKGPGTGPEASRSLRSTGSLAHERHHSRPEQGDQALCRRSRDRWRRFRASARRDPRAGRRERRRKVDADQGHGRSGDAHLGDDDHRRRRGRAEVAARGAPSRHRHGVPGEQPRADDDGRAEPLPRPGALLQSPARHLHRRATVPAVAELRRRSDGRRRRARRGQEADGRDRARRAAQGQGDHLRRADRDADARGEEILLRSRARPQEARRVDRLHLARARRGADARRPHHRAARRQEGRHRRRCEVRPRAHRPGDGRARPVAYALRRAQDDRAPGRASAC